MIVATNSSDSSCIEAEIKKKTVLEKVFYLNLFSCLNYSLTAKYGKIEKLVARETILNCTFKKHQRTFFFV